MPTIKDALDIIGKLTVAEQESLKTMLLSPAFVKSLNIEDFVAKERFANGIDLVQLKTGKAKKGIYNIQHINSYHSQLKRFMRGFNGVSTKYLNNYLVWNNLVNYAKESDMEKRNIFLTFVLATLKTAKCRDLSNRPAVHLVA